MYPCGVSIVRVKRCSWITRAQQYRTLTARRGKSCGRKIFVAVLGASSYTFVEAQPTQSLESFIGGHVRAFEFFGGVPELIVPDNLKAGVKHADRYEPVLNATYQEMASHYGAAIMPARPRKPKDKPKAEAGVLLAERWILAVLRHRRFFSLAEINQEIGVLLKRLNEKPFQKLEGSRKSLFEHIDKPASPSASTFTLRVRHLANCEGKYRLSRGGG